MNAVTASTATLNLSFRADNCASLSLNKHAPGIRLDSFHIQEHVIPALDEEDHYHYLGVPISLIHNVLNTKTLVDELTTKLDQIHHSLLAPWQKLDVIRTFIQPCLTYALRSMDLSTKCLQGYCPKLIEPISLCRNVLVTSASLTQSSRTIVKPLYKPLKCSLPPIPLLQPSTNGNSAKQYHSQLSWNRHPLLCRTICLMLLIHPLSPSAHEPNLFGQGLVVRQSNSLSPSTSLTMLLPPSQHSTAMIPSAPRTHAVSSITFAVTMLLSSFSICVTKERPQEP